jgi:hypothetical protein
MEDETENVEIQEIVEEVSPKEVLDTQKDEELSEYTDYLKECMKTGKSMKQCALMWKKEKEEEEDVWSEYDEQEMEKEVEKLMKDEMAAPKMSAIVYAMKKAGVSEDKVKKAMQILRQKYPYPYPNPTQKAEKESAKDEGKDTIEKSDKESLEAENKALKEKLEQMSKLERKSVKSEGKREELSEDEVYAQIIKGIRGGA